MERPVFRGTSVKCVSKSRDFTELLQLVMRFIVLQIVETDHPSEAI
jgi:hypothetical protein